MPRDKGRTKESARRAPGGGRLAARARGLLGACRGTTDDTRYIVHAFRSSTHTWFLLVILLIAQIATSFLIGYPLRRWVVNRLIRVANRDNESAVRHLTLRGHEKSISRSDREGDPAFLTAVRWALENSAAGSVIGCATLVLAVGTVVSFTCPLWWWSLPSEYAVNPGLYRVDSWAAAAVTPLVGLVYLSLYLALVPRSALWHSRLAHRTLLQRGDRGLLARITQITASRDDALEVHRTELQRIERDLHDGTQNRLVAVRVHLGLLERILAEDPERAWGLLETTKDAADEALRELRHVVRSIYPPLLADRGLASAVSSLAARCALPCSVEADGLGRAPVAVETAAYFVVAEALTNVHKHSNGSRASVVLTETAGSVLVRVTDDGHGGADEHAGSGLAGLRRRVASLEGTLNISSPADGPTTVEARFPCAY